MFLAGYLTSVAVGLDEAHPDIGARQYMEGAIKHDGRTIWYSYAPVLRKALQDGRPPDYEMAKQMQAWNTLGAFVKSSHFEYVGRTPFGKGGRFFYILYNDNLDGTTDHYFIVLTTDETGYVVAVE